MKVKELPTETNLTNIKVKLPDDIFKLLKEEYTGVTPEMYIIGSYMGDFFLSQHAPTINIRSLCPILGLVNPSDILEWEVIE